ncbi:HicB family protein [Clostridia bacterium]|nr:HicB family protein [Clostridia bacterium]
MRYAYPACFYREDDGRYSVEIPDLGLATFGDNLADAIYMASDAASGRLLSILRDGQTLPAPTDVARVHPDDESGFVSVVCADVDPKKGDSSVKKTLTLPAWLNEAAERRSINFSAALRDALIMRLAE